MKSSISLERPFVDPELDPNDVNSMLTSSKGLKKGACASASNAKASGPASPSHNFEAKLLTAANAAKPSDDTAEPPKTAPDKAPASGSADLMHESQVEELASASEATQQPVVETTKPKQTEELYLRD